MHILIPKVMSIYASRSFFNFNLPHFALEAWLQPPENDPIAATLIIGLGDQRFPARHRLPGRFRFFLSLDFLRRWPFVKIEIITIPGWMDEASVVEEWRRTHG